MIAAAPVPVPVPPVGEGVRLGDVGDRDLGATYVMFYSG